MAEPFVRNTRTGKEPEPAMLHLLCDGDRSTYLTDCGLDIRPYFHARVSHPVTFRVLHGHFEASLYRPTRRERLQGWWYTHRWPLLRGLVLWLSVLAFVIALNLLKAGADVLADWISSR